MELMQANKQWMSRPDDERYATLQELYEASHNHYKASFEKPEVLVSTLRVENVDGDIRIVGKGGVPANVTNWAFSQLCQRVKVPAGYMRTLPATLAAQNLNHGLARRVEGDEEGTANLLFTVHDKSSATLRALTSNRYERVWNYEVADRLLGLQAKGWEPATPDIRQIEGNEHQTALYVSDHDLFAFIRNPSRTINEPGNPNGLQRGLIAENSEVGAACLKLTRFFYREMCGNHIIWGASEVVGMSARHVRTIREKMQEWDVSITKYMDESSADDEQMIARAMGKRIAGTKEELLDAIFGKKSLGLSRNVIEASVEAIVEEEDGDPLTVWGVVQGITRYSQTLPYADKRSELDKAAGKLMEAF